MGILLTILALTLLYITSPISIIYAIIKRITKRNGINTYFIRMAIAFDKVGNVISSDLFNDIMIKKEGYRFGLSEETISSVLGKNKRDNTLLWPGRLLSRVLDKIQRNHVEISIENNITPGGYEIDK